MEELADQDPLFAAVKRLGRKYTGVCRVKLLDLADQMNVSPLEIPRMLFRKQCQGVITYEAERDCFCIEMLKISNKYKWLSQSILEHMWKVEKNTLSKLSATYILCRQSSYPSVDFILAQQKIKATETTKASTINEQLERSSSLIHNLNNLYFNSLEGIL